MEGGADHNALPLNRKGPIHIYIPTYIIYINSLSGVQCVSL